VQYQLNIFEAVQEASVNDVHQMGKVESAVGALGPPTVAAEELTSAAVSQKPFHWILEIH
jgi:hypothetical protein